MRNKILCTLVFLIVLSVSSGIALAGPPPIPADYSGSVTVNGKPAPDGTEVFAKIEDYKSGSVTTSGGSYKYLLVEPPNDNYINKTIEFWVRAPGLLLLKAVPTDVFTQGTSPSPFDLTVTPTAATVTTGPATDVGTSSATLNASIGYGDYSSVDIQFRYKVQGAGWSYTPLSSGYKGASYSIGISGLDSDTTYEFKAEISFDNISVSGGPKTFTTAPVSPQPPPPSPPTGDTTPPPTPSLISPADGENIIDNTPLLDWSDVSDPSGVTYDLSIARDAGFTSIVLQKTDLTASAYELTSAEALVDDNYYWHVRGVDGVGNVGSWSENWSFMVYVPPTLATLTADTTPIKASVYVDGALWGTAPQTKSVAAGTYTVSFGDLLDYLTPPPQTVTLSAGETRTVTGFYTELVPAPEFELSNLVVDPSEVGPGETVTVSIVVTNVGELEGTCTVTLKINNIVEATEDVTLAGGATETVTFPVSRDVEGTYNVEVDGLTGTFVVTTPPPSPTVPLALAVTGIALLAGGLGYAVYRQKKLTRLRKTQLRRLKWLKKTEEGRE